MKELAKLLKKLVPAERLELSWAKARGILSPVRLPVSPRRHLSAGYFTYTNTGYRIASIISTKILSTV